jgi:hypothetical protein
LPGLREHHGGSVEPFRRQLGHIGRCLGGFLLLEADALERFAPDIRLGLGGLASQLSAAQ